MLVVAFDWLKLTAKHMKSQCYTTTTLPHMRSHTRSDEVWLIIHVSTPTPDRRVRRGVRLEIIFFVFACVRILIGQFEASELRLRARACTGNEENSSLVTWKFLQ